MAVVEVVVAPRWHCSCGWVSRPDVGTDRIIVHLQRVNQASMHMARCSGRGFWATTLTSEVVSAL